ncbi:hypothetical protein RSOLAG22IIIB_13255 [Rhizoctonia solani]|uniref:G2/mitotic-specific cyclin cdc13 n=1 Tax=Rhizoctonia solani TaxID=456999 RepID=A0A0K6FLJ0_9AGAM|nr:hypothetical protein RSOLAG22IIIB_13255 [Rhizoctonia solani]
MSFSVDIDPKFEDSQQDLRNHEQNPNNFNMSVLSAIEKFQKNTPRSFQLAKSLINDDSVHLFRILLEILYKESYMDRDTCSVYLAQHLALHEAIHDAYYYKTYANLLGHPDLPSKAVVAKHASGVGVTSSDSHNSLAALFKTRYRGNIAKIFINTLDRERNAYSRNIDINKPYNWAVSVVRSSGMGKSRMVEEAGKTVFTIPINLREDLPHHKKTYPPPDINIREYFVTRRTKSNTEQQAAYAIFMRELFNETLKSLSNLPRGSTGAQLARTWADHLAEGAGEEVVGINRKKLYDDVVQAAEDADRKNKKTLSKLRSSLQDSCRKLQNFIQPVASEKNAFFVYFDEAHMLEDDNPTDKDRRSAFYNLGTVLSELTEYRVFFIFLSANSIIQSPATQLSVHRSALVIKGGKVVPPFTELPIDIFEHRVLKNFNLLTLEKVGETATMANFGRPLWYAQHQIKTDGAESVFELAMSKLAGSVDDEEYAVLAALGVRVGITFDEVESSSYATQSRLVESHLRVVYSIPKHREYLHTGTPSEPVLAEAAAQYLVHDKCEGIGIEGPRWLSYALQKGLLAREERGELVGRLLVTIAHDMALDNYYRARGPKPPSDQPQFHRPIPVIDFLCALFNTDHHEKIRSARSITGRSDIPTLRDAFSGSYVFFSHFALAKDSEMLSTFGLATALVRGMAIQAKDNQRSIDAVIPIHMGSPRNLILPKTTSAIHLQFKNRKDMDDVHVDRLITVPDKHVPVISIIFELGAKGKLANTVEISTVQPGVTRSTGTDLDHNDHHYEILVRSCSPAVFGVISDNADLYTQMLGAGSVLEDFPRHDYEENLGAFWDMKPAIGGREQKLLYGKGWDATTGNILQNYQPTESPSLKSDDGVSEDEKRERAQLAAREHEKQQD